MKKNRIVKCVIADYNVSFQTDISQLSEIMKDYISDFDKPDISLKIFNENYKEGNFDVELNDDYQTIFADFFRKLSDQLPSFDAFVLHSACFDVNGVGVAFAAHSGIGKTTHMLLWKKLLGEKMFIVNGDKPIVRFFDDEPETAYAYGSPWNGKENFGCNMRTKLQHICFIERSETNFVEALKKEDVINLILNQVYMPKEPIAALNTMRLINRLLSGCKLWKIHCNISEEAAEVAYNAILNL